MCGALGLLEGEPQATGGRRRPRPYVGAVQELLDPPAQLAAAIDRRAARRGRAVPAAPAWTTWSRPRAPASPPCGRCGCGTPPCAASATASPAAYERCSRGCRPPPTPSPATAPRLAAAADPFLAALRGSIRRLLALLALIPLAARRPAAGAARSRPSPPRWATGPRSRPQRYLADTDAAGAAVAEFTRDLTTVGNVATPEALTRAAPALRATLQDAEALSERLSAERVEDTRLEAQRARAAAALEDVVAAMRQATDAASGSRPTRFVQAVDATPTPSPPSGWRGVRGASGPAQPPVSSRRTASASATTSATISAAGCSAVASPAAWPAQRAIRSGRSAAAAAERTSALAPACFG